MAKLIKKRKDKQKNIDKHKQKMFNSHGYWGPHGIQELRVRINKQIHPRYVPDKEEKEYLAWDCKIKSRYENLIDAEVIDEQIRISHCERHRCGDLRMKECSVRLKFRGEFYGIDGHLGVSECFRLGNHTNMGLLNDEFVSAAVVDGKVNK